MRVVYVQPSYKHYELLFAKLEKIRGGSLHDIEYFKSPIVYQRGSGFFSSLAGVVRRVLPFLRGTVLPAAADMARNIAHDYSERKKAVVGGKRKKAVKVTKRDK